MTRLLATGASLLPSFPADARRRRILREPATANGPTVPPRQYFGLTTVSLLELVASVVRSKAANGRGPERDSLVGFFAGKTTAEEPVEDLNGRGLAERSCTSLLVSSRISRGTPTCIAYPSME